MPDDERLSRASGRYSWHIWVFLGSRISSTLGDQLLQFTVPLIVFDATGSVSMSGLAFLTEWLPRLTSLPLAGLLADRFGGRRIYATADSGRAIACVLTVLALGRWPGQTFVLAAALLALCGFSYAQAFIALESTVPQLVAEKDLAKAQSLLQMINNGSGVFGPALGGVLLAWMHPAQLLWVNGAVFAVSACGVIVLSGLGGQATAKAAAPRRTVLHDLRVGARSLTAEPVLLSLVGLAGVVNLMVGLAMSTNAALTIGQFHEKNSVFASLQITVGALSIAAFVVMPWLMRRITIYRIGILAFAASALGGVMIGAARSFPVYVLGYGLCIGLCGLFNVFIRVERLHWIGIEVRGRVISLIVLLNQSTLPLAGLLVAVAGGRMPVRTLFFAVGAIAAVASVLIFRPLQVRAITARKYAPRHRRERDRRRYRQGGPRRVYPSDDGYPAASEKDDAAGSGQQYRMPTLREYPPAGPRSDVPDSRGWLRPEPPGPVIRRRETAVPGDRPEGAAQPVAGPEPDDLQAFARDLRVLRAKAGLDYPEMAKISQYEMKTLAAAAGGLRLPSLPVAVAYVRACNGDVAGWQERWQKLTEKVTAEQAPDSRLMPAVMN